MVERNLTLPYEFVCFTENPVGINPNIRIESLPKLPVKGWWYKLMCFDPNFALKGNILFLDLDLIVFQNIDSLFTYSHHQFCVIRDFNRTLIKNYSNINSSVFRLTTGDCANVYNNFIKDINSVTRRFRGDQEWIYSQTRGKYVYWPDTWIQSYKWEMRDRADLIKGADGKRNFVKQATPSILPDAKIAVFHGEPNPADCKDQWVLDNWR